MFVSMASAIMMRSHQQKLSGRSWQGKKLKKLPLYPEILTATCESFLLEKF